MTEKELEQILENFRQLVLKSDLLKKKEINFFTATKMLSLETKHSAFLAWLLQPDNEHCLGNAVLKKMLRQLYAHQTGNNKKVPDLKQNKEILKDTRNTEVSISSSAQIEALAEESKIFVETERKTNNDKRIDIFIDIADKETVIVVENKIDSDIHDNQLREYENYVFDHDKYKNYKKKIFIYLTKKADDLPFNKGKGGDGQYTPNWCVLTYFDIVNIIEELIDELKKDKYIIEEKERDNLIHILEDYKKMVETNILNTSKIARNTCKKLLADPQIQDALQIIDAYRAIPTPDQISEYVCEKLGGLSMGRSKKWFYTPAMKDYFVRHQEDYDISKCRCVCQVSDYKSPDESKIAIFIDTSNEKTKVLTAAQIILADHFGKKSSNSNPRLIKEVTLVEANERGMSFDDLKPILDQRIDDFKKGSLGTFEKKLSSL